MTDTHTAAHIPDEAVQAAEAQFTEYFLKNYPKDCIIYNPAWHAPKIFRAAKAAITENTPNLSAPCAVEVKKLDWVQWNDGTSYNGYNKRLIAERCHTEIITYFLEYDLEDETTYLTIGLMGENIGSFDNVETAKAAAQADFERRILSCVATKPVDAKWSFDDWHIGEIGKDESVLASKLIARPTALSRDQWYILASDVCVILNNRSKPSAKPVDVAALLKSAALIIEGRSTAINSDFIQKLSKRNPTEIASLISYSDMELGAAIRALSPAEPAQAEQWQPIETAPKDGTRFLAALTNDWIVILSEIGQERYAWYQTSSKIHIPVARTHPRDSLKESILATHWMPLPAAPTSEAGK